MDKKIKETLEKQLQLLSERSEMIRCGNPSELVALTVAMCKVTDSLLLFSE